MSSRSSSQLEASCARSFGGPAKISHASCTSTSVLHAVPLANACLEHFCLLIDHDLASSILQLTNSTERMSVPIRMQAMSQTFRTTLPRLHCCRQSMLPLPILFSRCARAVHALSGLLACSHHVMSMRDGHLVQHTGHSGYSGMPALICMARLGSLTKLCEQLCRLSEACHGSQLLPTA